MSRDSANLKNTDRIAESRAWFGGGCRLGIGFAWFEGREESWLNLMNQESPREGSQLQTPNVYGYTPGNQLVESV